MGKNGCQFCGGYREGIVLSTDLGLRDLLSRYNRVCDWIEKEIRSVLACWHPIGSIPVIGERDES